MNLSPRKQLFVDTASEMFGNGATISKPQIRDAASKAGVPFPSWFKTCKVAYNQFKLPSEQEAMTTVTNVANDETVNTTVNLVATNMERQNLIPSKFVGFVGLKRDIWARYYDVCHFAHICNYFCVQYQV